MQFILKLFFSAGSFLRSDDNSKHKSKANILFFQLGLFEGILLCECGSNAWSLR